MTRIFFILFSLNAFTGGMFFGEIAKMPALAEHYRLHQAEEPDTTLVDFLWLHYVDPTHESDPSHDHQSLPFHHQGTHTSAPLICALPETAHTADAFTPAVSESLLAADFYYCHYLPTGFVGSLFQPPKV